MNALPYIRSFKASIDLQLIILLTILTLTFVMMPKINENPIRILLGIMFVLFFPGYSLVAALFPRDDDLDGIERFALSIGLSVAVVPLLGLLLNYAPWGIRLNPILFALSTFTILCILIAVYKRALLPEEERFSVSFKQLLLLLKEGWNELWHNQTGRGRILSLILIASMVLAVATMVYVVSVPKQGERFTEFYILGPEGKAADYPTSFQLGEEKKVIVGVANHEGMKMNYILKVELEGSTLIEKKFS
ncbi:MAG: DUF1616 domain-containing protein, partial [Methermicoccaceae archaeon]